MSAVRVGVGGSASRARAQLPDRALNHHVTSSGFRSAGSQYSSSSAPAAALDWPICCGETHAQTTKYGWIYIKQAQGDNLAVRRALRRETEE